MTRRTKKPESAPAASTRSAAQRDRPSKTVAAPRPEGKPNDRLWSLTEALNRLTPEERLICLWKALGFSNYEIARYRRTSVSSTETLYRRIRAKMRRLLK